MALTSSVVSVKASVPSPTVFASRFATTRTPEQKREGEITQQRREAEAEATLDYSRYTATNPARFEKLRR